MIEGVEESEVAFDHEAEVRMSPYDPRAEAIARGRGMSEEEIAMIKAGLKDVKAGRLVDQDEMFARLKVKYGG